MSSLTKQPRRLDLNIGDGCYQQFEKPLHELDFTIHNYISKSEVKTGSSRESEVKMHSAHESEVKKQSSHDSTAVEDICNICAAITIKKKQQKKLLLRYHHSKMKTREQNDIIVLHPQASTLKDVNKN